ncbi:MAG: hypothetical protein LBL90_08760 [Prevotellaceae bacterium]|nr:hypothetical protein [Prevotellaceae bacterium]
MFIRKKGKCTADETRVLKRCLMRLLEKLFGRLEQTVKDHSSRPEMPSLFYKRLSVVREVLSQQTIRFEEFKVKDLIASIGKDYILPIAGEKKPSG